jgi:hypothetical protein
MEGRMATLLNPVGVQEIERFQPAVRAGDLRGKRVALVWNGKQNGEVALRVVGERLTAQYPGLTTELVRIGYGIPKDQLEEIRSGFDAAVAATGD